VHRPNPSQVTIKTAFTVAATVLAMIAVAWMMWRATDALLVTLAALLLAIALNHLVDWLQRHHVPRSAGIAMVMLALLGLFVGLGFAIVPPAIDQVTQLVNEWPRLLDEVLRSSAYSFLSRHANLGDVVSRAERVAPAALGTLVAVVRGSATIGVALVTVLFVTLFMLTSGGALVRALLAQARPERRPRYAEMLLALYAALGSYVAGHAFIIALQGFATSTFLALMGVPFFLGLGVLSALASLIPFAGLTIMGTVITAVAWATKGPWAGVATAGYFVVYQQVESHLVSPIVYRRAVEVNPLVTIVAVFFLGDLGGIAGAVVALPLVVAGHVFVRELLAVRRERLGIPPLPPGRGPVPDRADHRESAH
jgi:putative heme transporter